MKKLSALLLTTVLWLPGGLSAQTASPETDAATQNTPSARWSEVKTCPAPDALTNEFYHTISSAQYIQDTRWLAENCGVNTAAGTRMAFESLNRSAFLYLLSKTAGMPIEPAAILGKSMTLLDCGEDCAEQAPQEARIKDWNKICGALAKRITAKETLSSDETFRKTRPEGYAFYFMGTSPQAFKKVFSFSQKQAKKENGSDLTDFFDFYLKECTRREFSLRQGPSSETSALLNENLRANCQFVLKKAPHTTRAARKYVLWALPDQIPAYLNKNTPERILTQAFIDAPEQHRAYLLDMGARVSPELFFIAGSPAEIKRWAELGADINAHSSRRLGMTPLEYFIWQSNQAYADGTALETNDSFALEKIQALLENGANPNRHVSSLDMALSPKVKALLKKHGAKHADQLRKEYNAQFPDPR